MNSEQSDCPHLGDRHQTLLSTVSVTVPSYHQLWEHNKATTSLTRNKQHMKYRHRLHWLPGLPPSGGGRGISCGKAGASSKRDSGPCQELGALCPPTSHHQPQCWQVVAEEVIISRLVGPSPEEHSLQSTRAKLQKQSTAIFLLK